MKIQCGTTLCLWWLKLSPLRLQIMRRIRSEMLKYYDFWSAFCTFTWTLIFIIFTQCHFHDEFWNMPENYKSWSASKGTKHTSKIVIFEKIHPNGWFETLTTQTPNQSLFDRFQSIYQNWLNKSIWNSIHINYKHQSSNISSLNESYSWKMKIQCGTTLCLWWLVWNSHHSDSKAVALWSIPTDLAKLAQGVLMKLDPHKLQTSIIKYLEFEWKLQLEDENTMWNDAMLMMVETLTTQTPNHASNKIRNAEILRFLKCVLYLYLDINFHNFHAVSLSWWVLKHAWKL